MTAVVTSASPLLSTATNLDEKRLFVGNIPLEWNEWNLFHIFKQFGVVHEIYMPQPKSESPYRFGFIEMYKSKGVRCALHAAVDSRLTIDGIDVPLIVRQSRISNHTQQRASPTKTTTASVIRYMREMMISLKCVETSVPIIKVDDVIRKR